MPFDVKKFKKTTFEHAFGEVPLPAVFNDFFDKGEPRVWKVRGLTGQEVGRAAIAAQKNKNLAAMLEAAGTESFRKLSKMYKELAGTDKEKVPQEIAEAMEKIIIGSVEPIADIELVALLCTRSATAFYAISKKIRDLTEGGMVPGKPAGSGSKKKSSSA